MLKQVWHYAHSFVGSRSVQGSFAQTAIETFAGAIRASIAIYECKNGPKCTLGDEKMLWRVRLTAILHFSDNTCRQMLNTRESRVYELFKEGRPEQ